MNWENVSQWIIDNAEWFSTIILNCLLAIGYIIQQFTKPGKKKTKKIVNEELKKNGIENANLDNYYIEFEGQKIKLKDLNIKEIKK